MWWRDLHPTHVKLSSVCTCSRSSKTQWIPLGNYKVAKSIVKPSVKEGVLKSTCVTQTQGTGLHAGITSHFPVPCCYRSGESIALAFYQISNLQSSWNLGEQHRTCNTAPFSLLNRCSSLNKTILIIKTTLRWERRASPQAVLKTKTTNHKTSEHQKGPIIQGNILRRWKKIRSKNSEATK